MVEKNGNTNTGATASMKRARVSSRVLHESPRTKSFSIECSSSVAVAAASSAASATGVGVTAAGSGVVSFGVSAATAGVVSFWSVIFSFVFSLRQHNKKKSVVNKKFSAKKQRFGKKKEKETTLHQVFTTPRFPIAVMSPFIAYHRKNNVTIPLLSQIEHDVTLFILNTDCVQK